MYHENGPGSFLCMSLSSFPQHYLLKRLFCVGYSFMRCWRLLGRRFVCPFLGFLFCSIELCVSSGASTILFWWLQLCNTAWSPELWYLQLWFSFSGLLWLFVFFFFFSGSNQILEFFILALWRMLMLFSWGLHWICTLLWVVLTF